MLRQVYYEKSNVPSLPANRKMKNKTRLESLERKFQKNTDFVKLYHDQIEEHIALDHARQLSKEEAKQNSEIINHIPITEF